MDREELGLFFFYHASPPHLLILGYLVRVTRFNTSVPEDLA